MSTLPVIDWPVAVQTSAQTMRRAPRLAAAERAELVAELLAIQPDALAHATRVSGLPAAPPVPARVVGRQGWVEANVAAARHMLGELADDRPREQWGLGEKVRGRALAAQLGLGMGWVAGKIIGQFQPYGTPEMLVVGPNVAAAEREMSVDGHDFRMWVSVHEQTHRLQFAAAPWLRDYLRGLLAEVVAIEAGERPRPTAAERDSGAAAVQRIAAVMSVLEGHAETMMNRVEPDVIGSVAQLRDAMQRRRAKPGLERVVNRALGLDVKLAQYRDGAQFCAAVIAAIGIDGLNQVFADASRLPSDAELHDPDAWLRRVG